MICARQWSYDLSTVSSFGVRSAILPPNIISLTFWWIVQTHTACVPLAPAKTQCFRRRSANLITIIAVLGSLGSINRDSNLRYIVVWQHYRLTVWQLHCSAHNTPTDRATDGKWHHICDGQRQTHACYSDKVLMTVYIHACDIARKKEQKQE